MMSHGYLPPTNMVRKGTNLDEQDLEEQSREEAYTEAWEMSLAKVQDMINFDCDMNRDIQKIVEVVAGLIMIEDRNLG
jgi:hypothetical protein